MALFGTSDKGTDMFSLLARFKEEEIKKILLFEIQVIPVTSLTMHRNLKKPHSQLDLFPLKDSPLGGSR